MDLTDIKLVVTDMDGTLLNSKGKINESFFPIFERLKGHGIKFAVASGRQYYSLTKKFERVENDVLFIAENGAIVIEKNELKHIQPMKRDTAIELIETVRKIGGKYLVLCGRKSAYIEHTDPKFMDPFLKHYEKYEVVEDLTKVENDDFLKVTICDLSGAETHSYPHVKHFEDHLQVKLSGEIWIDFTHRSAQKGNALLKIQDLYGISPEETMAFGDYLNDLELFDHSVYSFAMGNARDEVREKARHLTASNDERGVEIIMEKLLGQLDAKNSSSLKTIE